MTPALLKPTIIRLYALVGTTQSPIRAGSVERPGAAIVCQPRPNGSTQHGPAAPPGAILAVLPFASLPMYGIKVRKCYIALGSSPSVMAGFQTLRRSAAFPQTALVCHSCLAPAWKGS